MINLSFASRSRMFFLSVFTTVTCLSLFAQNPIVTENALPGTPESVWDIAGAGDLSIQGFATDISVNKGDTVHFKINTDASAYTIQVYRIGYYQGNGARFMGNGVLTASLPQLQPNEQYDIVTGLTDCGNWAESGFWKVPANAVSGVYIAKLTRTDNGGASHIVFIVRDDASTSDILFKTADATWQAYNNYGGNSLYVNGSGTEVAGFNHATKVSYNRPFYTRNGGGGGGAMEDWLFNAEYPMIRFMERNGYDMSYTTDLDMDRSTVNITPAIHKLIVCVGHDEYWSLAQRTRFENARDAGVSIAFFDGNELYWKTRWEDNNRTLVCYKEGTLGENICGDKCDPEPNVWTGLWRDGCNAVYGANDGCRPENALTGQISWDGTQSAIEVPDTYKNLRFWRNTSIAGLGAGQKATLPDGTLGYEWDWNQYSETYPPGRITLSKTVIGGHVHKLSLYRHSSGAWVFGAGTVQWSWGLDSHHDRGNEPEDIRMQQATVNLFADMGVQPATLMAGLVPATTSTDVTAPVSTITDPLNGAVLPANAQVTISGTASDAVIVAGVEVSVDGGLTWLAAEGTTNWTFTWTPTVQGPVTIKSRAFDDSGNMETEGFAPSPNVVIDTVGVGLPVVCPCTIFNTGDAPGIPLANDNLAIELGIKFQANEDGYITGLRYYKGAGTTGVHVGHLWTSTGTLLTSATFTNETASGWQQVALGTPVPVVAGTTYVASYFSPSGDYAYTDNAFSVAFIHGPLKTLADGEDGPNGVYKYTTTSAFPTDFYQSSNYWMDVVFDTYVGPDTTAPTVLSTSPASNATGVNSNTAITITFSEGIDPSSLSALGISAIQLYDSANQLVNAVVSYNAATHVVTANPAAALNYGSVYKVVVKGGVGYQRIKDIAGNALAADYIWHFTTSSPPPPPPNEGPGGPILVISAASNPFSRYPVEMLRAEGFNEFMAMDISNVNATVLNNYDVVIVGEMPLSAAQVTMLTDWTNGGGTLITLRPDAQLLPLLGLSAAGGTIDDKYLLVNTASAPGTGIVNQTIQYHGQADRYTLSGATAIATLYSDATTATTYPAVTSHMVGTNGGQAFAFTYDLAKSIVYTRQGNPAWAGQKRDGQINPIRSDDMFYPDWIDFNKVAIPQADEQQHLLSNIIAGSNLHRKPLPKFWFLPKGLKAAIVMTGDDHGDAGMQPRFDIDIAASTPGCSVENWDCIRSTGYLYVGSTFNDSLAKHYSDMGFEVALHVNTNCNDYNAVEFQNFITNQLSVFTSTFPSIAVPTTNRNHCIAWSDFSMPAEVEAANGIRLDVNYYYWPASWVQDRPGMFTGSGMPMRFAKADGTIIDCYQAATQMPDESGESFPQFCDALLDKALGTEGYYGVFTTNMHFDYNNHPGANAIVASAQAHGVPVITAKQLLDWLDGRNGSSFGSITWNGNALSFTVAQGAGANNLKGMVPFYAAQGQLTGITYNGTAATFSTETIKGIVYAFFNAPAGNYVATYSTMDTTAPVISNIVATPHSDGTATISWTTDEASNSNVYYGQSPLNLNTGNASLVTSHTIVLTGLTQGSTYHFRVSSSDVYSNTSISPIPADSLSFTMPIGPCITDQTAANFNGGTVDATTSVVTDGDGAVILNPAVNEQFSGSSIPAGWNEAIWDGQSGTATTYGGGQVSVNGTHLSTAATFGMGTSVEFYATYTAGNFQNVGFTADADFNAPWVVIGRGGAGDNNVYARSSDGHTDILGTNLLNAAHKFRIQWTASNTFQFYVDDNLVATPNITINGGANMNMQISDYPAGGVALSVDWLRISPYANAGTFISHVFDAGAAKLWAAATWSANLPTNTSITVSVRKGNTAIPDGSWTAFAPLATSGAVVGGVSQYLQYKVELTSTDNTVTPVFKDIAFDCSPAGSDLVPPVISNIVATPHTDGTATITWNTNEVANSAVNYAATPAALTSNANDAAYVTSHSITVSGLTQGITYNYRVTSVDTAGNSATSPIPSDSLSFTMPVVPCVVDQTTADFNLGTVDANTTIISDEDGGIALKPLLNEEFSGGSLPAGWGVAVWDAQAGASTTYSGGQVSVDGTHAYTLANFGPGTAIDYVATYSAGNFQNVGFTADADFNSPWVVIGRGGAGDNNVYARSSDGHTDVLGTNLLNTAHHYRIEWTASNTFLFYVDDILVATPNITITAGSGMLAQISDYPAGGVSLAVDRMTITPYAAAGSFTSRVFDAGSAKTWGIATWHVDTPAATTIAVFARKGNTAIPDGTWTAFAPIASSGSTVGGVSQYIQYRADLSTSTSTRTPVFKDINIECADGSDIIPPVITNIVVTTSPDGTSATITWTTDEESNSEVDYGTDSTALNLQTGNATGTVTHSITLTGLTPGTTYWFNVTSVDGSSNASTSPNPPLSPLSFTTPVPASACFVDVTTADFTAGSTGGSTYTTTNPDGEVILNPAAGSEFSGTTVPAGWGEAIWDAQAGALTTYSSGQVTVDGTHLYTTTSFGPGTSIEYVATYTNGNFQNVGFTADDQFNNPWVVIGRGAAGDNDVYARTWDNQVASLGSTLLNAPHRYRIQWNSGTNDFQFYVDGVLISTPAITATVSTTMNVQISDYPAGGYGLAVDWIHVSPYSTPGTFESRIYDAGAPRNWADASWNADVPSGTALSISVRKGDTPTPDGSWTAYTTVATSGGNVGGSSRYIQYKAELSTTNTSLTPALRDITISCTAGSDEAPVVNLQPVTQTACAGMEVVLVSHAGGSPAPVIQWQFSSDNGNSWNDLPANTDTLRFTALIGYNGYQYRAIWTNTAGADTSDISVLTVNPQVTAAIDAFDNIICANDTIKLQLNTATGQSPFDIVVNGVTYNNVSIGETFATISGTPMSIWGNTGSPANPSVTDNQPIEVGTKFRSTVSGYVTGVRFYKGATNTGTHVGSLWTTSGTQLAFATFTNESASGWQEVTFASPVLIQANTTYIVSYFSADGYFAINAGFFAGSGVTNGPLTALQAGVDGPNGVYKYGGGFPDGGNTANYWVDVLFTQLLSGSSYTYNLTSVTDNGGCTTAGNPLSTASVQVNAAPAGTITAGTYCKGDSVNLTFNAAQGSGPFSLTINGDSYNGVNDGLPFYAGLASLSALPMSIWPETTTPANSNDASEYELGVRFRSTTNGTITGIRFYKPAGNTGVHTGELWTSSGTLLASAVFTNETASGWQQVNFPSPVSISANTTYVASYHAPNGNYGFTGGYFTTTGYTNGPLTALQSGYDGSNGVFNSGAGIVFPTQSFNNANYWVDVVFVEDNPATTINYSLTAIVDNNGCSSTGNPLSTAVANVTQVDAYLSSQSDVLCYGLATGSLVVAATGGTAPYTYYLGATLNTTGLFNDLAAGSYNIVVVDASGCSDTLTATINEPASAINISETHTNVSCFGGNNGSIDLNVSGGVSPYTYNWSNGANTQDIAILYAGIYTVTVSAANGCNQTASYEITQPSAITYDQTIAICSGASVTVGNSIYTATGNYTDILTAANGCDSTVTTHLTVNPTYSNTHTESICQGGSYNYYGTALTATGDYSHTMQSQQGCDSVDYLHLDVYPIVTTPTSASICQGASYSFNGQNLTLSGIYYDTLATIHGCDSIIALTLTVNPVYANNHTESICQGSSYNYYGTALTTTGDYSHTMQSQQGCDSIDYLHLDVYPIVTTPTSASICQGASYSFNGQNLTASGTYYDTLATIHGCDSIIALNLTVNPVYANNHTESICQGSSYNYYGTALTATGDYSHTMQSQQGCDSIDYLHLDVYPVVTTSTSASICQGASYSFNGQTLTASGTYYDTLATVHGCDSIIALTLTVNPTYSNSHTESICQGSSYSYYGTALTTTGDYSHTMQSQQGCDSIDYLHLDVYPVFTTTVTASICQGASYSFNGQNLTASGTYYDTLATIHGCDSIIALTLTVNPTYSNSHTESICQGGYYNYYGTSLTATGDYSHMMQSQQGCDSIDYLHLDVYPVFTTPTTASICQGASFSFNGQNLTVSGTYYDTLATIRGCDSIIALTLTVNPVYANNHTESICQGSSYNYYGTALTATGDYSHTMQSQQGCDSIDYLHLDVYPVFNTAVTASICQGATYSFNGQNLTTAGLYFDTLTAAGGCDSIIALTLTVNPTYSNSHTESICQGGSYNYYGIALTTTGDYSHTMQSQQGCDSIDYLHLDVYPVVTTSTSASICQGATYSFNGQALTASGTYYDTLATIHGCDSIIALTLIVNPTYSNSHSESICQGGSYNYYGTALTATGDYLHTMQSQQGCDSIDYLHLDVYPVVTTPTSASICQGASYSFNGQNLTVSGLYYDTLATIYGCDSIIALTLTVNPVYANNHTESICQGSSYNYYGTALTATGDYLHTMQSQQGCDSIDYLHLDVYPVFTTPVTASICQGASYNFNGQNLATAGLYFDTLTATGGCDSIIALTLTVNPVYANNHTESICQGSSYNYYGTVLTATGDYSHIMQSQQGCDSIDYLHLDVYPVVTTSTSASICQGASYSFNGQTLSTAGLYFDTLTAAGGCDSIIALTLTVNPTYSNSHTESICQGSSYNYYGTALTVTGDYSHTMQSQQGCDSVDYLHLDVYPVFTTPTTASICQGATYSFNGQNLVTAGLYFDTLTATGGCDSIIVLTLTVNPTYSNSHTESICQGGSYNYYGTVLTATGDYSHTMQSQQGCDSVDYLHLDVYPVFNTPVTASICQGASYSFNGQTLTASGIYYDTLATIHGCDSIVALTLTVNPTYSNSHTESICQGSSYNYYGTALTATGDYSHTMQSQQGCDSIDYLHLDVYPVVTTPTSASICQGASYSFNGQNLTTAGLYFDTLTAAGGCDSIIALTLTVNPVYANNHTESICQGGSYNYFGTALTATGDYSHTMQSQQGCDSVDYLHLDVYPVVTTPTSASICQGASYSFNGQNLTTAGLYFDTLTAAGGCDSIIVLTMTINPTYSNTHTESICQGGSYNYYGIALTATGDYSHTMQSQHGCDSIDYLHLDVYPVFTTPVTANICQGSSYGFNGQNLTASGTYYDTLATIHGCDSVIALTLTVNPVYANNHSESICQGGSYNYYGIALTATGDYSHTMQSQQGCDSIDYLHLDVYPVVTTPTSASICQGASYSFNGQNLTASGTYYDTLATIHGCDSIIALTLTVNPVYANNHTETICQGSSYNYYGTALTATGDYSHTMQSQQGCDSIDYLHLDVYPVFTTPTTASICQGATYSFNGQNLATAGLYFDTLTATGGCDSIIALTLTVNPTYSNSHTESICQGGSYNYYGTALTATGDYSHTMQSQQGCDSIDYLHLDVYPVFTTPVTASICQGASYSFNGQNLTVGGTYYDTLATIHGCDSIIALTLNINPTYSNNHTESICQGSSYNYYGTALTATGDYSHTMQSQQGCDSIDYLHLDVYPVVTTPTSASICQGASYSFNGQSLTVSGIYYDTLATIHGCDSIIALTLTVNPTYSNSHTESICQGSSYNYYGTALTATGDYSHTMQSQQGCDSVDYLHLDVYPVVTTPTSASICQGASYNFDGQNLTVSGLYYDTLATIHGCDSIIALTLTVNPTYSNTHTESICQGGSYNYYGTALTATGDYSHTMQSQQGCDSIDYLHLDVYPVFTTPVTASICQGASYSFNGQNLTASGIYYDTLATIHGCDSIIALTLTVNPTYSNSHTESICQGGSYNYYGTALTATGDYSHTMQSQQGCDSIDYLHLDVYPVFTTPVTASICQGTSYSFDGQSLTVSGIYYDTLATIHGCDSIIALTLTVNPVYANSHTESICQGSSYNYYGTALTSTGNYSHTMQSQQGCDSIDYLHLDVYPVFNTPVTASICQGASYSFNGQNLTTAGLYFDTLTAAGGCDSIIVLTLTVNPTYSNSHTESICQGGSYNYYGTALTATGDYSHTMQSQQGCDSIDYLHLDVYPVFTTPVTASICQGASYSFNGQNLTTAGLYFDTLTAAGGCDSIIALTLTVNPIYANNHTESICQGSSYNYYGTALTATGDYSHTMQSQQGCDSIDYLHLDVYPVVTTPTSASICQGASYSFNGQNLTVSGTYYDTLATIHGCDSIIALTLTVNPVYANNHTESICQGSSYNYYGTSLTTTGNYSHTMQSQQGCDSIDYLHLDVYPVVTTSTSASICQGTSYSFNGQNLTVSGTYSDTLASIHGCDSVVTLTLTVNPVYANNHTESICQGHSYNYYGLALTTSGNYSHPMSSQSGCDSTDYLHLVVIPAAYTNISGYTCFGSSYFFNGQFLTQSGIYTDTFTSINGCDSFVVLNLHVKPVYTTSFNVSICQGSSYYFNGQALTQSGSYSDTLSSAAGCDSFVNIVLTVKPSYATHHSAVICQGSSYTYYGIPLYTSGVYSHVMQSQLGCDSIDYLNLTVQSNQATVLNENICQGSVYNFGGKLLTQSGVYFDTLTSSYGCDSFVVLTLTVNLAIANPVTAAICKGDVYHLGTQSLTQSGVYYDTLVSAKGCDSIVVLSLTVTEVSMIATANGSVCTAAQSGATYQWYDCSTGQPVSGAISQSFTASQSGSYQCMVTLNSCTVTTNCVSVTVIGIDEISSVHFQLYPNPGNGLFILEHNYQRTLKVNLVNPLGALVREFDLTSAKQEFDLRDLAAGVYYFVIADDKQKLKIITLVKQ